MNFFLPTHELLTGNKSPRPHKRIYASKATSAYAYKAVPQGQVRATDAEVHLLPDGRRAGRSLPRMWPSRSWLQVAYFHRPTVSWLIRKGIRQMQLLSVMAQVIERGLLDKPHGLNGLGRQPPLKSQ